MFSFFVSFGQNKKDFGDEILYAKGTTLLEVTYDEDLYMLAYHNENEGEAKHIKATIKKTQTDALKHFNELIEKYPNSEHIFRSLYEKGNLEYNLENYKAAKETLNKVVNFGTEYDGYYKNKTFRLLAEIAIEEKNYEQALQYLDASKNQKVTYTCGNALEGDKAQLENMYKRCNEGLIETKK